MRPVITSACDLLTADSIASTDWIRKSTQNTGPFSTHACNPHTGTYIAHVTIRCPNFRALGPYECGRAKSWHFGGLHKQSVSCLQSVPAVSKQSIMFGQAPRCSKIATPASTKHVPIRTSLQEPWDAMGVSVWFLIGPAVICEIL